MFGFKRFCLFILLYGGVVIFADENPLLPPKDFDPLDPDRDPEDKLEFIQLEETKNIDPFSKRFTKNFPLAESMTYHATFDASNYDLGVPLSFDWSFNADPGFRIQVKILKFQMGSQDQLVYVGRVGNLSYTVGYKGEVSPENMMDLISDENYLFLSMRSHGLEAKSTFEVEITVFKDNEKCKCGKRNFKINGKEKVKIENNSSKECSPENCIYQITGNNTVDLEFDAKEFDPDVKVFVYSGTKTFYDGSPIAVLPKPNGQSKQKLGVKSVTLFYQSYLSKDLSTHGDHKFLAELSGIAMPSPDHDHHGDNEQPFHITTTQIIVISSGLGALLIVMTIYFVARKRYDFNIVANRRRPVRKSYTLKKRAATQTQPYLI